jgi:hypothetical protein
MTSFTIAMTATAISIYISNMTQNLKSLLFSPLLCIAHVGSCHQEQEPTDACIFNKSKT